MTANKKAALSPDKKMGLGWLIAAVIFLFNPCMNIIDVLPELCSLSDYEYDGYVTAGVQIDFANYKTALLIVGLFLTTLIGIMWLINVIPYIKRIGKDAEFM